MATLIYVLMFLASCLAFYFSGELIVKSLIKIAKFLGWKEFVVSFLIMAFVGSLPNLFVGISSALAWNSTIIFWRCNRRKCC